MSLLIALDAASIFSYSAASPMILAAFLTSLHISSSRVMVLTMAPSWTSVSPQTSANVAPPPARDLPRPPKAPRHAACRYRHWLLRYRSSTQSRSLHAARGQPQRPSRQSAALPERLRGRRRQQRTWRAS